MQIAVLLLEPEDSQDDCRHEPASSNIAQVVEVFPSSFRRAAQTARALLGAGAVQFPRSVPPGIWARNLLVARRAKADGTLDGGEAEDEEDVKAPSEKDEVEEATEAKASFDQVSRNKAVDEAASAQTADPVEDAKQEFGAAKRLRDLSIDAQEFVQAQWKKAVLANNTEQIKQWRAELKDAEAKVAKAEAKVEKAQQKYDAERLKEEEAKVSAAPAQAGGLVRFCVCRLEAAFVFGVCVQAGSTLLKDFAGELPNLDERFLDGRINNKEDRSFLERETVVDQVLAEMNKTTETKAPTHACMISLYDL
eukprot:s7546_g1.t1